MNLAPFYAYVLAVAAIVACAEPSPRPKAPEVLPLPDVEPPSAVDPDDEGDEVAAIDVSARACRVLYKLRCTEAARLISEDYPQGETCTHLLRRKTYLIDASCISAQTTRIGMQAKCHACRR